MSHTIRIDAEVAATINGTRNRLHECTGKWWARSDVVVFTLALGAWPTWWAESGQQYGGDA